jgi:hypothetical protein
LPLQKDLLPGVQPVLFKTHEEGLIATTLPFWDARPPPFLLLEVTESQDLKSVALSDTIDKDLLLPESVTIFAPLSSCTRMTWRKKEGWWRGSSGRVFA